MFLAGATISNVSSTILEFKLTEVQRAKLIQMSGTPVETGWATVFEPNEGAFTIYSGKRCCPKHTVFLYVLLLTRLRKQGCKIRFGTSIVTVTSNETLSTRPENQLKFHSKCHCSLHH